MKVFLAFLLLAVSGIAANHQVHLIPAHIICKNVTEDHDILLPDPNDCSIYYKCEDGFPVPQSCPPDLLWCQIMKQCTLPSLANCTIGHKIVTYSPEELATLDVSVTPPVTTTITPTPTPTPSANIICPTDGVLMPNPLDCTTYYECINENAILKDCPEGEGYSCWDQKCLPAADAACISEGSQPGKHCSVENVRLQNVQDCSSYLECQNGSVVQIPCAPGFMYSERNKICVEENESNCHTYPTLPITTTSKTTPKPVKPSPNSDTCPINGALLPNPADCSTYYKCINHNPKLELCGKGLQYSCWDQKCLPPNYAQCIDEGSQTGITCTRNKQRLPNPENCRNYYECVNGIVQSKKCPFNKQYNKWFGVCLPRKLAHCTSTTTLPPHTTITTVRPSPGPEDYCPYNGALLPDPTNCSAYFKCEDKIIVPQECPTGQEYSCWDETCENSDVAQCIAVGSQLGQNCSRDGVRLPNIVDCQSFYECRNGKVEKIYCVPGRRYNKLYGQCVFSGDHCEPQSTLPPTTTSYIPTTERPTLPPSSTENICPVEGALLPNPLDCKSYYVCRNNMPVSEQCPDSTAYSCWDQACEQPDDASCITNGTQEGHSCSKNDEQLQDPNDCSRYYKCVNGKVETKLCAEGTFYNQWYKMCLSTSLAHCQTSGTTTQNPTPTTTSTPSICPTEGDLLPNPIDCTTYYECIDGTPILRYCPEGDGYNCWDEKCEPAANASCISDPLQIGQNCSVEGLRQANIQDCKSYLECQNGEVEIVDCAPGFMYDGWNRTCVEDTQLQCHTFTTHPTTTTSRTTSLPVTPSPDSDICPTDGGRIPNPSNCSTYYSCINKTPTLELCGEGLQYNCWEQQCLSPNEAVCITQGLQTGRKCKTNKIRLENPENCISYYECVDGVVQAKKCPENLQFNKWFRVCVPKDLSHCTQSTTLPPHTTVTTEQPSTDPEEICPIDGALLPDPTDCTAYYKCKDRKPVHKKCSAGEAYSCWNQTCAKAYDAQCIAVGSQLGQKCSRDGVRLPNIEDCHNYYECRNGKAQLMFCSPGKKYNQWYDECVFSKDHCEVYSTLPVPTTTPVPTTPQPTRPPSSSENICPVEGAILPNLLDCKSYYVCRNNTPVTEKCPDNTAYSCWDQECKQPDDATCITSGTQEGHSCSKDNEQLQDPNDCNRYYKCVNGKIEKERCTDGTFYNQWYKMCLSSSLAHCQTTAQQQHEQQGQSQQQTQIQAQIHQLQVQLQQYKLQIEEQQRQLQNQADQYKQQIKAQQQQLQSQLNQYHVQIQSQQQQLQNQAQQYEQQIQAQQRQLENQDKQYHAQIEAQIRQLQAQSQNQPQVEAQIRQLRNQAQQYHEQIQAQIRQLQSQSQQYQSQIKEQQRQLQNQYHQYQSQIQAQQNQLENQAQQYQHQIQTQQQQLQAQYQRYKSQIEAQIHQLEAQAH